MFIDHVWSQQVYELIAYLRSANQNARNPTYLVQFFNNMRYPGAYFREAVDIESACDRE